MPVAVLNASLRTTLQRRLPAALEPLWFENSEQLLEWAPRAEIAWLDPISPADARAAIERMTSLKWYNAMSSGVDWLPLPLFKEHGVVLTNGAGIHAQSVAEYAIMGMLTVAKGWRDLVRAQDRHEWLAEPPGRRELLGAQVLVIGAGEIGTRIVEILNVIGARTTVARRSPQRGELNADEWRDALGQFDWIIVIVPATAQTAGMIGAAEFARMKQGAVLVNFSRGTVIDQAALIESLDDGHLGGAFLDVTDPEPLPADHPLWSKENVHISMHLSGRAQESLLARGAERFLANLERYCAGEVMAHQVDLERGY